MKSKDFCHCSHDDAIQHKGCTLAQWCANQRGLCARDWKLKHVCDHGDGRDRIFFSKVRQRSPWLTIASACSAFVISPTAPVGTPASG